ncbi:MAG TPA: hypothetical protein VGH19_15340 [Verrucomicrobiae bacterium]
MLRKFWCLMAVAAAIIFNPVVARAAEALNNAAVIEMQKLGLGEGVLLEKIRSSKGTYDVSIKGLGELKSAGVTDNVIQAMIAMTSAGQVAGGQMASGDVNNPSSPHEAGIWIYEEVDGKPKMTMLEPSVYNQVRSGVAFFAAYGQSANREAVIRSAKANTQTTNRKPVFYFYFEKTQGGLSDNNSVTSANEFTLAQFKVDAKQNVRKLIVGSFNIYGGSKSGPDEKAVRSFDLEKLASGVYKVTPREDLANGEYGFFYGGTTSIGPFMVANDNGGKIFDFGVNGSPETEPKAAKKKTTTMPKR